MRRVLRGHYAWIGVVAACFSGSSRADLPQSEGSESPPSAAQGPTAAPATDSTPSSSPVADSLAFVAIVPPSVPLGKPVPVVLRVTNTSARIIELSLLGREAAFDVKVRRGDGSVVWRRLEGAVLPMILQLRPIAPGESVEFRGSWNQRATGGEAVEVGTYEVVGELPGDAPQPLRTSPVRFSITAP